MERDENIYLKLRQREYWPKDGYRRNCKILKTIVCKGRIKFRKVWEKQSTRHISCEGINYLFFDNYRLHYSGSNLSGCPHQSYHLPSVSKDRKIEDALILHSSLDSLILPREEQADQLISITANNILRIYNSYTGQILHELNINSRLKFREIAWAVDQETFVIRSVHNKLTQFDRQAGRESTIVKVIAVFDVLPLKFVGMIEIDRQIWGKDVIDSMVAGGMLIIMHQSGFVRFFSFHHILKQYGSSINRSTTSVSVNILVTEYPPVLLEVKCSEHNVQMGGFPWHYMITPHGSLGRYSVCSFMDRQVIEGGSLHYDHDSVELDTATFHDDESGRIVHIGYNNVRVLQIVESDDNKCKLQVNFHIVVHDQNDEKKEDVFNKFSSSGRQIKRKISLDEIREENNNVTIHDVDYENELDVLCINSVIKGTESSEGFLGIYDNYNGRLLREIKLLEPFSEFWEHRVILDRDTIIQIIKSSSSKVSCIVYKLFCVTDDSHDIPSGKQARKTEIQTTRRSRARRR
ncbi:hypothetical protein LOTGIDRAFT_153601 [Lottia gigantea]|uniref:DDB1- and CUL4-associated factor 17 n=1 Tax=Lottia gigantea TaxID=225164 RepID=V4A7Z3_LOTGI|nr:hypothetical protein LOTGIDRAFT_153601 [Lottia gigantea]ESO91170.1 hypothetical protein LOTGIDRAFT_153601 [Lottia gigantea]